MLLCAAVSPAVGLVRFDFEGIVPVGLAAAQPEVERTGQIGGDEERSPAFVLTDVHAFVFACGVERGGVASEDDVAKRDGAGAEGFAFEEPAGESTVALERVIDAREGTAAEQGKRGGEESEQRSGRGPDDARRAPQDPDDR